jgi:hypothetical protein
MGGPSASTDLIGGPEIVSKLGFRQEKSLSFQQKFKQVGLSD